MGIKRPYSALHLVWRGADREGGPPRCRCKQPLRSGADRKSVAQTEGCVHPGLDRSGQGRRTGHGCGYNAQWEDESQSMCSGHWPQGAGGGMPWWVRQAWSLPQRAEKGSDIAAQEKKVPGTPSLTETLAERASTWPQPCSVA